MSPRPTTSRRDLNGEEALHAEQSWRCTWQSFGLRCFMLDDGGGYCMWHGVCLKNPRWQDDYEEFTRWWESWYGPDTALKYCAEWSHHTTAWLWERVHGRDPGAESPKPCRVGNCPHQPLDPALFSLTPKEHLAKIQEALSYMGTQSEHE